MDKELHKDIECASCKHLFTCEGKPREVKQCIKYEGRTDKNEKDNCNMR